MSAERDIEFSVVIVTYNNAPEIGRCLSALHEAGDPWRLQVVVVDNHSTDATLNVIRRSIAAHAWQVEVVENPGNRGFTAALNQGLRRCQGAFILVLNPDTEVERDSLAILKGALTADPRVGVVAPQLLFPDGRLQPSCRRFPRHRDVIFELLGLARLFPGSPLFSGWKMGDFAHQTPRYVDQPQGACLLFGREVLEAVGYWDEDFPMFFSDVDWCRRVKAEGWEILFAPAARVVHHKGCSVMQQRVHMIWSSHRSFYRYFKKHHRSLPAVLLNEVLGAALLVAAVVRMGWTEVGRAARRGHARRRVCKEIPV